MALNLGYSNQDIASNLTTFKNLTPDDTITDNPLLNVDLFNVEPAAKGSASNPNVDSASSSLPKQAGATYAKAGLGVIQGYMKADAIRKKANYEADILQLNADFNLFEAGEQQGVDFSKIIRSSEQANEVISNIQSEFTRIDQEGGAAQDLIAENTLQARLNQMAMMNEAQAKVSSAQFARKLSYLKAQQARDISQKQGRQAVQAGYAEAALMFVGA